MLTLVPDALRNRVKAGRLSDRHTSMDVSCGVLFLTCQLVAN